MEKWWRPFLAEVIKSISLSLGIITLFTVTLSRFSCSAGQSERLPDSKEADKLARAILLCVDMEKSQPGTELSKSLESLLAPLLETLSRVSTNIYLPLRKSDKSLQLVLRLLQLERSPGCQGVGGEQGLWWLHWFISVAFHPHKYAVGQAEAYDRVLQLKS